MNKNRPRLQEDSGSIAPIGISLFIFVLAMMFTVISASSLFIFQKRLTTLAEAAAVFVASGGESTATFIEKVPQSGFRDFKIKDELLRDERTIEVVACALWMPPLLFLETISAKEICSHAAARASS